ncbi:MAG: hypothetical protein JSW41_02095 [Candidatus Aenigmatarchaeota archaeon]|nr:MAG: hypothetical protein JSW41_02095 [Candidatus Aenigmarchaeota archaeon]
MKRMVVIMAIAITALSVPTIGAKFGVDFVINPNITIQNQTIVNGTIFNESDYLLVNGSRELTGNWDAGNFSIIVNTTTFVVNSTTGRVGIGTDNPVCGFHSENDIARVTWTDAIDRSTSSYFRNNFTVLDLPFGLGSLFGVDSLWREGATGQGMNAAYYALSIGDIGESGNWVSSAARSIVGALNINTGGIVTTSLVGMQGKIFVPNDANADATLLTGFVTAIEGWIQSSGEGNAAFGGITSVIRTAVTSGKSTYTDLRGIHITNPTNPGSGGSITRLTGIWIDDQTRGNNNNYGIYSAMTSGTGKYFLYGSANADSYLAGDLLMAGDNVAVEWGAAQDASCYYDGTDLICDPKVVGSGLFKILGNLNVTDNFTGNFYYAEMYNYSANALSWNFDIDLADTYYNMTNLTLNDVNGFSFTANQQSSGGSYLTTEVPGLYNAKLTISFDSIAVGGLFGMGVVENFDVTLNRECYSRREAAIEVGNAGVDCLMRLDVGDTVNVQVENENTNRDMGIHTVNLNLIRVGD